MTLAHYQSFPQEWTTPAKASRPWQPWCDPPLNARLALLDWVIVVYALVLLAAGATDYYRIPTYVGYIVAVLYVPWFFFIDISRVVRELILLGGLAVTIGISATQATFDASISALYMIQVTLMFAAVMARCDSFPRFKAIMVAALIGASIVAVAGLVLGEAALDRGTARQVGITRQSNAYGWVLTAGVFASFVVFHMSSRLMRWVIIASWFLFLIAIAGSGSRQAIVNVCGMLFFYALLEWIIHLRGNLKHLILGACLASMLGVILLVYFSDSALVQRLLSTDIRGDARIKLMKLSWEFFKSEPLWGIGPGGMAVYTTFVYTHSTYTELLATTGIFSFLFFGALTISMLWRLWRARTTFAQVPEMRRLMSALLAVAFGLTVSGIFHLTHTSKIDTLLMAALIGIAAGVNRQITS